uniref:Uncharacterized protein n=1 Tax=Ananas comosus var. bracteatus TaxID=296719 RepID=A0A6V7PVP7_ANACO|nr:unnamed protein product [Ananas comosus var. bracteatus]
MGEKSNDEDFEVHNEWCKMTRSRKLKGVTIVELTSQTNGQGGGQDGVSNIEEDGEASLAGENFQIVHDDGKRERKRGRTTLKEIWEMDESWRIQVRFNKRGQPINKEARLLAGFCGIVARNGQFCPLNYINWRRMPIALKNEALSFVMSKFQFQSKKGRAFVMRSLNKKWKDYKAELKAKHFDRTKPKAEISKNVPPGVVRQQWLSLVDFLYSDVAKKREKLAKESRAKQKYTYTSGSKSFARKEKEIEDTTGKVPGLVEMFELTHTKKNGSFISDDAKKLMVDAKDKLANCSGTSESSREDVIAMENKIYIEVIRKEYGGRVGGLGLIPSESCVCYNSESTEEVQKLREEVQENKKMVSQLQSQLVAVMEFIRQKMPDCNLGGSRQDLDSSGTCYTSASSNPSSDT